MKRPALPLDLPAVQERATAHVCHIERVCHCWIVALEPDEDCPVHGWPPWRCTTCGRFLKRDVEEYTERMREARA